MRKVIAPVLILAVCLAVLSGCVGKPFRASPGLEKFNGFRADKEGCVAFFSSYDYDIEFTWSGACVPTVIDGQTYNLAQGPGTLKVVRLKDGKTVQTYDGEMRNGRYHGRGKAVEYYDDGAEGSYDGDWVDDEREGRGRLVDHTGSVYEGSFKNDKLNGRGTYVICAKAAGDCDSCFNFAKYVGEFRDNYLHGRGTSYDAAGQVIHKGLWFKSSTYKGPLASWKKSDAEWVPSKAGDE